MGREDKKEIVANCPYCGGIVIRRAKIAIDTDDKRETVFDMNCPNTGKPYNCGKRVKLVLSATLEAIPYHMEYQEFIRLQKRRR